MPTLYLSSGDVVSLGPKLGEGGEGAVYEIAGHEGFVAKLYHGHIDALKVR